MEQAAKVSKDIPSTITLAGGDYLITDDADDAFRVLAGDIYVYIVPIKQGMPGRRSFLGAFGAGRFIPAFAYRDKEFQEWRFLVVAERSATLERIAGAATNPLKRRFLKSVGIADEVRQGFDDSLVNHYRTSLVKEDGYFVRTARDHEEEGRKTNELIASLFSRNRSFSESAEGDSLYRAVRAICVHAKIELLPFSSLTKTFGLHPTLEQISSASHFPIRAIQLEQGWYKADAGYLVVFDRETRKPAACIPSGRHHYKLYEDGLYIGLIDRRIAAHFDTHAVMVYKPLPKEGVSVKGLARFCRSSITAGDIATLIVLTVASSLIALLIPNFMRTLYDDLIPFNSINVITQIGLLIIAFIIGNLGFEIVRRLCRLRLTARTQNLVQNAAFYRIFELPENVLSRYDSTDLAQRVLDLGTLAAKAMSLSISSLMSIIMSVFFLWQMFLYSWELSLIGIAILVGFNVARCAISLSTMKRKREIPTIADQSQSLLYQWLEGIETVKASGFGPHAVYEYIKLLVRQRRIEIVIERRTAIINVLIGVVVGLAMICFFLDAYGPGLLSIGGFVAFITVYGMLSSVTTSLVNGFVTFKHLRPIYNRSRVIIETPIETKDDSLIPDVIDGSIEVSHVTFSYDHELENVLNDITFSVKPGENIGIVGKSGSGKSTLLKLLLGFERPTKGSVYYSGQDMADCDLSILRRKFGVVLQDGAIVAGSIYDNIALTNPTIAIERVHEVIDKVGLTSDIATMPMGVFTLLPAGGGTLSGGQRQKILLARALVNEPAIMFLDEATSALDNISQKTILDALDKAMCTKILVAQRLSTIEHCDRILVLDHGTIAETGTYAELINRDGLFAQLAGEQAL